MRSWPRPYFITRTRGRPLRRLARWIGLETLEPRHLLAGDVADSGDVIIDEFLAINDGLLEDFEYNSPDWVELLNCNSW